MDFLPYARADEQEMLATLGLSGIQELFEPVPEAFRMDGQLDVPEALSEPELMDHLAALSSRSRGTKDLVCFAGGGSYDHHVPAAVRSLASRAEFATSYTPYQPELSQGVLQALYEFQTLVCEIYGLEVANASLYDGASALAEAVNLAVRATRRERVVVGATVHPHYLQVLRTYTSGLGIDVESVPFDEAAGVVDWNAARADGAAAVVAAYPNVFGRLEELGVASELAHAAGALSIAVADPTAMGILKAPGEHDVDIAVGEGQALGSAMSYGGPGVGLLATKLELVRQVPGRIAGQTVDADGRRAFVLTLQAREQHIRRAKATSNVCTNQTLLAIAAGIHLAWLGPRGLARLGEVCARRAAFAAARLGEIPSCRIRFAGAHFKEFVLELPVEAGKVATGLARHGFLVGPALGRWYPQLANCMLVAVTERRSKEDILELAEGIEKELAGR